MRRSVRRATSGCPSRCRDDDLVEGVGRVAELLGRDDRPTAEPARAAPYGRWSSPITAELIVSAKSVSTREVAVGTVGLWWAEASPGRGRAGRSSSVRRRWPARRPAPRGLRRPAPGSTSTAVVPGGCHGPDRRASPTGPTSASIASMAVSVAPEPLTPEPAVPAGRPLRRRRVRPPTGAGRSACVSATPRAAVRPTNELVGVVATTRRERCVSPSSWPPAPTSSPRRV